MTPRKLLLTLALTLGALGFAGLCLYMFHRLGPKETPTVTLVSPNGQKTVVVSEKVEESGTRPPSRSSVVRFSVFHNGGRVIANEPLLVDSPGLSFLQRYPKQVSISDSTLRFVQSTAPAEPMPAEVSITNNTTSGISYLRVLAGDLFLLTDIPAQSTSILEVKSVSSQRGDVSDISSRGRFADGREIREESVNFNVKGRHLDLAHYSIVINDAGTSISSQELERFPF